MGDGEGATEVDDNMQDEEEGTKEEGLQAHPTEEEEEEGSNFEGLSHTTPRGTKTTPNWPLPQAEWR